MSCLLGSFALGVVRVRACRRRRRARLTREGYRVVCRPRRTEHEEVTLGRIEGLEVARAVLLNAARRAGITKSEGR